MKMHFSVYLGYFLSIALYILMLYMVLWLIEVASSKTRFKMSPFKQMKDFCFVILAFSYIGMTLGLLTGLSLSPVVQAVVPALLVFLTGLTAYMFKGKESKPDNESKPDESSKESMLKNYKIAVSALIFIPVFLMYGLEIGAAIRVKSELKLKNTELEFKKKQLLDELEVKLDYLKELKKLGLDSTAAE